MRVEVEWVVVVAVVAVAVVIVAARHLGRRLGLLLLLLVLRVGLHLLPLLRRELGHHRALGGAPEEVEVRRPLEAVVGGAQVGGGDDEVEVERVTRVEPERRGRPLRPRPERRARRGDHVERERVDELGDLWRGKRGRRRGERCVGCGVGSDVGRA